MKNHVKRINFLETSRDLGPLGKTGVSMHCHTLHSKESLDFVPYYAAKIPIVSSIFDRERRRYFRNEGKYPDFNKGYWEPPLTGQQVFAMEKRQMSDCGLDAIVSITDHDSINANLEINLDIDNSHAPISMEWTVPYRCAYFHVGVHNLPVEQAEDITRILLDYTRAAGGPDNEKLHEIFAMLSDLPSVLVVLNHPIWDIEMIGQALHDEMLKLFVAEHSERIHAIEVNGFRPWSENKAAIELAEALRLPLISGGDRHCLHSNTMINVTNAASFSEFIDEIRVNRHSSIVVMPEYRQPLAFRQVSSMAEVLGYYPENPVGRQRWFERVYFDADDGTGARSLASHWAAGAPAWHAPAIRLLSFLGHQRLMPIYNVTVSRIDLPPIADGSIATATPIARRLDIVNPLHADQKEAPQPQHFHHNPVETRIAA